MEVLWRSIFYEKKRRDYVNTQKKTFSGIFLQFQMFHLVI